MCWVLRLCLPLFIQCVLGNQGLIELRSQRTKYVGWHEQYGPKGHIFRSLGLKNRMFAKAMSVETHATHLKRKTAGLKLAQTKCHDVIQTGRTH